MKILSNHFLKIFLLCFWILISQQLLAQIPQQMNYQGAVRDNGGKPIVNLPITIRLSILDNGPNSASVYTEVRQLSTNGVGLYNVAIGKPEGIQSKTGDFAQINWGTGAKYLKVEVDLEAGNNFTTAGVSPLLSVPYTLYAKYAENGPQGAPGPAGPAGAIGPSGPAGAIGPAGPAGAPGPIGPEGDIGYAGGNGVPGAPGTPGIDGSVDMYVDNNTGIVYVRDPNNPNNWLALTGAKGDPGAPGPIGPEGDIGYAGGNGVPGAPGTPGIDGSIDMYVDNTTGIVYVREPNNPNNWIKLTGAQGLQGIPGRDGRTILSGLVAPAADIGEVGDFYLDKSNYTLWGPKTEAGWIPKSAFSLIGPVGPQGPPGGGTGTLTNGNIFVGDGSNIAEDVPMKGDATIANVNNEGILTIANGAITNPKIANQAVSLEKMAFGPPNQIYTTDSDGEPAYQAFNSLGWSLTGNAGTAAYNFLGTTDAKPLIFKVNNKHSGRLDGADVLGNGNLGTTSFGYLAGASNTAGYLNTFIGYKAGELVTNGSNTIIGAQAGDKMTGVSELNIMIGANAGGDFITGLKNVFIGASSGSGFTSGSNNFFIGNDAGQGFATSDNVFALGNNAGGIQGITNAVAIGNNAIVKASNSIVFGGSQGGYLNLALGTDAPTQRLHIKNGHIRSEQTQPPTIAFVSGQAFGLSNPELVAGATDMRGEIRLSGTNNSGFSTQVRVDFNIKGTPGALSPIVSITPYNNAAAKCAYYIASVDENGFTLLIEGTATNPVSSPRFGYMVID